MASSAARLLVRTRGTVVLGRVAASRAPAMRQVLQKPAIVVAPADCRRQLHTSFPACTGGSKAQVPLAWDAPAPTKPVRVAVGTTAVMERRFSEAEVAQFAALSGDDNPLHVDPAFAAKTRFGRCIVHGVFINAVLSALMGKHMPGYGTIFMGQEMQFKVSEQEAERRSAVCLHRVAA